MFEKLKKTLNKQTIDDELFQAFQQKNLELVQKLIQKVNVNVCNEKGETPLIMSVQNGWHDLVGELIQKGADINLQDKTGKTALMYSFLENNLKTAHLLIDAGADIKLLDKMGNTAALYGIQRGLLTLMSFPEKDRNHILKQSFQSFLAQEKEEYDYTAIQFICEYLLRTMERLSKDKEILKDMKQTDVKKRQRREKIICKTNSSLKMKKGDSQQTENQIRVVSNEKQITQRMKGRKMSKIKIISVMMSMMLFSAPAWAGLSEALTAYGIKRYDQAFAEFSYLAEEGDATAAYYLGKMYANGEGVEKNNQKAVEYYQKAEAAYNIDAAYELAEILLNDATDTQDENFTTGLKYLKRAAYAGQADALYQLGEFYEKGNGVPQDYKSAFGFYLLGALKGDMKSQYRVSRLYLAGRGVPQDFENGLKWLSRSARQGYVMAQRDLADARVSMPTLRNLPDAYAWYSIIAAFNSDEVGEEARKKRNEIEKKIKKKDIVLAKQRAAREWRPVPAEKSVPASDLLLIPTPIIPGFNDAESVQAMLAQGEVLLTDGRKFGVQPDMVVKASINKDFADIEKAINSAAGKGETQAYAYYGDLLRSRFQNDKDAVEWYRKGAESGDAYAQYQLAKAYCEGRGLDAARPSQCYAWLKIAENNSADTLKLTISNALEVVNADITPEELTQGEQLITEYEVKTQKPKNESDLMSLF